VNESSSSTDSESPLTPASGIHEAKEKRKVQGPEAAERKLGKALTKSFRYNLVNLYFNHDVKIRLLKKLAKKNTW